MPTQSSGSSPPGSPMAETPEKDAETLETLNGADEGGVDRPKEQSLSSSSDSESDQGGEDDTQLEALEKAVAENPSNYEAHVQYIQCLRKLGHIEKLRQARESMSQSFPLSPKMWQEWAKDEASLNDSPEAVAAIEEIYERGVHEYLSVPLWCDYINFIQERDQLVSQCAPAGVSKMRNLFERALTAAGLHVVEGSKIWDAYREFEQAIFLTIDDGNNEEKAKQIQHIRALFHRQLSVPVSDLKSTFLSYKVWEVEQGSINDIKSDEFDGVPANVASAYQKALEMYNARATYEDQLSDSGASDSDRLQHFQTYIKFEVSSGDPARVQILYERAVSEFPVSSDLWLGYTSYLDKTLKVPSVLKDVYSRATRNCTWVGDLWVRYLLSLERMGSSEKEMSAVFEQSLQCVFSSSNEYLDLFLTRVDGLRRRISLAGVKEDGLDYSLIRDTFQRAAEYLSPQLLNTDDLLRLYAYWAHLEVSLGKDLVAARGVWESLIKKSGSMLEVWRGYVTMEIELCNINEARSIYKRCYSKRFAGTGSEDICYSWLRFERELGTLEDFDLATRKVMPRLEELSVFRAQQISKNVASSTVQKESFLGKNVPKKRKMANMPTDKQSPSKKRKDVASVPSEISHEGATHKSADANDVRTVNTLEPDALPKAIGTESRIEQPVRDSTSKEVEPSFYTDQCTAFISNLSLEANEEHLREFFGEGGGVTAIRLLKDKFTGRLRGLAYTDFSDEQHLAAAIGKNRQKLLGNKLSIARSDPKQSQKRGSARGGSAGGHGRNVPSGGNRSGRGDMPEAAVRRSKETVSHRRGGHVQLTGKTTFLLPRAVVRPLGWSNKESKLEEGEEKPKSNEEFRKLIMKK